MIYFLMFLGIALSIVKANGWIIVPQFCIVFCWIISIVCWVIWSYAAGLAHGMKDEINKAFEAKKRSDNNHESGNR